MIVYMTHPRHGTHIAYSDDEVERCKANGWRVREDKPKTVAEPVAAPAADVEFVTPVPAPLPPRLPKLTIPRRKE